MGKDSEKRTPANNAILKGLINGDIQVSGSTEELLGLDTEAEIDEEIEIDAEEAGLPSGGYLEDLFTPSKWFEPVQKVKEKR